MEKVQQISLTVTELEAMIEAFYRLRCAIIDIDAKGRAPLLITYSERVPAPANQMPINGDEER